mmetsp:Transcript_136704/g.323874  ORF Transcript_136704/g.323874 Transcript_136704/m.323874 type:complete len:205 (-) Transcript_136704:69-683(-)
MSFGNLAEHVERGAHDGGVGVAQHFADLILLVEHRLRHNLEELVHRDDSLLPDRLLRVVQKLEDQRRDRWDHLHVDQSADGGQRGANLNMVRALQVPLHSVDQQQHQLVVSVQEQITGQVPDPLGEEVLLMRELHRVDVGEGRVMPEHLCINCSDHVLLHLLGRDVRAAEVLLQNGDLPHDDLILFLLGPTLPDALHQLEELLA